MDWKKFKAKKQEFFNKAYLGVVGQGGFARAPHGGCFYTLGEKHCAAGWLLTKEQQQHLIDLDLNSKPFDRANQELHLLPSELVPFVMQLQRAHDEAGSLDSFAEKMKIIALEHDLKVPEFTE